MKQRKLLVLAILVIAALVFTACTTPVPVATEGAAPAGSDAVAGSAEDLSRPHPQLSNPDVRKAIAHCIDRDALIASVYPYVDDEIKPTLRMDVGVPKDHWSWQGPYTDYDYDPALGNQMLDDAGFVDEEGDGYRFNLTFTTTNAQFRATWSAVAEQNLADCGIALIRQLTPASWWFGDTTGLARRDFELGAFAWVGQVSPSVITLYSCNQIPTPGNNWEGQNGMGWCNQTASDAAVLAGNSLDQEVRMNAFNTLWTEFANDMVSLPVFQRAEAEAWSLNLDGVRTSGTEYATASAADWSLVDGSDTVVIGFSQEPASMFDLVESAAVQRQASQLGRGVYNTQWDYDFQPVLQDGFGTIENGGATNEMVDVVAGDIVYDAAAQPVPLAEGTVVIVDGEQLVYDGTSPLQLPQLTVTYKFLPHMWSDGVEASNADFELAFNINCSRDSGATSFGTCDTFNSDMSRITWLEDGLGYTIQYLPGVQDPYYYVAPYTISPSSASYPSHQVLADGRTLADVPAAEWTTLPEIAEKPLSIAPYVITEWVKGQSMTFEANPYYVGGEVAVKRIVIVFVPDTTQLVAQLISGDVDYVEKATLGGGAEVQLVKDAGDAGQLHFEIIPSPTWEHIDMNLFIKER